ASNALNSALYSLPAPRRSNQYRERTCAAASPRATTGGRCSLLMMGSQRLRVLASSADQLPSAQQRTAVSRTCLKTWKTVEMMITRNDGVSISEVSCLNEYDVVWVRRHRHMRR